MAWSFDHRATLSRWVEGMKKGEITFAPPPKDPKSDKWYAHGTPSGFYMGKGATNPKGAAAIITYQRWRAAFPDEKVLEENRLAREEAGWGPHEFEVEKEIMEGLASGKFVAIPALERGADYNAFGGLFGEVRKGTPYPTTIQKHKHVLQERIDALHALIP